MLLSAECMTNDIDAFLLGHWHYRSQAQSNPHIYAQTEVVWKKEDDWYFSKNFYRVDGPTSPYREGKHKFHYVTDTIGVMENYRSDGSRQEQCDMHFKFNEMSKSWHGRLDSDMCTGTRGNRIVSEIHLYGDKLQSRDQGFYEDGTWAWGSDNLYKFLRKS